MSELLAPAGDFETALAAFAAGADAVYCGLSDFSARAFATNFSEDQLKDLIRCARARPRRRVYVTFNTVIDEADLETAVGKLARLAEIGPDAIIVQDLGVARLARKFFPELELHASTQLVAHNLEGVLALGELGFRRVVLARELSLEEITQIKKRCGDIELEVFIHGALCYSISGLCLYGAMEKNRSGNRGRCPYCCRQNLGEGGAARYPFSMKDLRLGEDVRKLAELGIASLKIEGRMKSPLYVASVTSWYRGILGASDSSAVPVRAETTVGDLETVFSRRTTELRFNGRTAAPSDAASSPIDPDSLGHLGTPVGTIKRVTRDREGRAWLRFHTMRALEKHDGLQFERLTDEGRHFGFGISEMRQAISRTPVFEVAAGTDVEVLLPEDGDGNEPRNDRGAHADRETARSSGHGIHPGDTVYCSMSNAVKRRFPVPSFRRSDYPGFVPVDLEVEIRADELAVRGEISGLAATASIRGEFAPAKDPSKTYAAVEKAFSKLGETDYRLGKLSLVDTDRRFAPMSMLNDLRRDLVEALDAARDRDRLARVEAAVTSAEADFPVPADGPKRVLKVRDGQTIPAGDWDEIVIAVNLQSSGSGLQSSAGASSAPLRLALPVWNGELEFNRLRSRVKALLREGYSRWECSDLATLRLLKSVGVTDITADWTLYAFNSAALAALAELGVRRFVASPENCADNLAYLAESGYRVEFLVQQSTPLFISLHAPAATSTDPVTYPLDGLYITTRPVPRTFTAPAGAPARVDLSWDAPTV